MTSIAIIGSGVSGLHLGLFLQQHDVPVTIYTDKTPEQIASGRLLNTVAHHHHTLERERALGVDHWDADEYGYVCHQHAITGLPAPADELMGFHAGTRRAADGRLVTAGGRVLGVTAFNIASTSTRRPGSGTTTGTALLASAAIL